MIKGARLSGDPMLAYKDGDKQKDVKKQQAKRLHHQQNKVV
jgi:hypothetical protein